METNNTAVTESSSGIKLSEILFIFILTLFSAQYIFLKVRNKRKNYPPGPVGLPFLGYLPFLRKEPHKTLRNLKEKYGDVMSVYLGGRFTVVLNSWDATKEILSNPSALDRPSNTFTHIPQTGMQNKNGKEWIEQRRFCFNTSRNLGIGRGPWETVILEEVGSLIEELKQSEGKPVEIKDTLNYSVSSNIISFLMGRRFKKLEEPEKIKLFTEFADVGLSYTSPSSVTTLNPWLWKVFTFLKISGFYEASNVIRNFSKFVTKEIARHATSSHDRNAHVGNDFICAYLEQILNTAGKSEHFFSDENLEGSVNILFLGASDTIFSSLVWLIRLMAKYRDVQQKVYDELMEVLGKEGIARYDEREKLPYTFAVMMESQRVSSIVPLSTTRCASQDITVFNYNIPKGANITSNLWAVHHDPKYWEQPEAFKPERFLLDGGKTLVKSVESFAPFSVGRRKCPGERIAWMELISYFSEIIKNFEISTVDGETPQFKVIPGLVTNLEPQSLCFKQRI